MNYRKLVTYILLLPLVLLSISINAEDDAIADAARQAWMVGYTKMQNADDQKETDKLKAISSYQDAQKIFLQVLKDYPQWNVPMVKFRIKYCVKQIELLDNKLNSKQNIVSKQELIAYYNKLRKAYKKLAKTEQQLREELRLAKKNLREARQEAADSQRMKQEANNYQLKYLTIKSEIKIEKKKNEELQQKIIIGKNNLKILAKKITIYRKAYNNIKEQLNEVKPKLDEEQKQYAILQKLIKDKEQKITNMQNKFATLEKNSTQFQEKNIILNATIKKLTEEKRELSKSLEIAKENVPQEKIAVLEKDNKLLHDQLLVLNAKVKKDKLLLNQLNELSKEYSAKTKELHLTKTQNEQLTTKNQELKKLLALKDEQIVAIKKETGNENQQQEGELQAIIKVLKQENKVEKEKNKQQQKEYQKLQLLCTKQTKQLKEILGKQGNLKVELGKKQKKEIENLKISLKTKNKKLALLETENENLKQKIDKELLVQIAKINKQYKEKVELINNMETKKLANQKKQNLLVKNVEKLTKKLKKLQKTINEKDNQFAQIVLESTQLAAQIEKAEKDAKKENKKYKELQKKLANKIKRNKDLCTQLIKVQEDIKSIDERAKIVNGLSLQIKTLQDALLAEKEKCNKERQEKQQANLTIKQLRSNISNNVKLINSLQKELAGRSDTKLLIKQITDLTHSLEQEVVARRELEKQLADKINSMPEDTVKSANMKQAVLQEPPQIEAKIRREHHRQLMTVGYLRQAFAAEKDGKLQTAIWNYQNVLKYDPDNAMCYQRLGLIAAEQGDESGAVQYLKKAFVNNPNDIAILLPLGKALVRCNQPEMAVSVLMRAVGLRKKTNDVYRTLGAACTKLGWLEAAKEQYINAFKCNKQDKTSAYNLALLLASQEPPKVEEAKKWYLEALKLGAEPDKLLNEFFGIKK